MFDLFSRFSVVLTELFSSRRRNLFALGYCLVCASFSFFPEDFSNLLQYDRELILGGDYWRMLTGHYVHFTDYHFVLNFAGIVFCGFFIYWDERPSLFLLSVLLMPVMISLGLLLFSDQTHIYRGFSAVFYGMLALGVWVIAKTNRLQAVVLALGLIVKVIIERQADYDVDRLKDQIGVSIAIDGHLLGMISGVAIAVSCLLYRRYFK